MLSQGATHSLRYNVFTQPRRRGNRNLTYQPHSLDVLLYIRVIVLNFNIIILILVDRHIIPTLGLMGCGRLIHDNIGSGLDGLLLLRLGFRHFPMRVSVRFLAMRFLLCRCRCGRCRPASKSSFDSVSGSRKFYWVHPANGPLKMPRTPTNLACRSRQPYTGTFLRIKVVGLLRRVQN